MDYYKCENCGKVFDEFEMNYRAAQVDKKCWCRACRDAAQQTLAADGADRCPVCGDLMEYHALPCEPYDENGECHCNAEHAHMTYIAHDKDCPAAPRR